MGSSLYSIHMRNCARTIFECLDVNLGLFDVAVRQVLDIVQRTTSNSTGQFSNVNHSGGVVPHDGMQVEQGLPIVIDRQARSHIRSSLLLASYTRAFEY